MSFECAIGISARHIHLSQADADILFGEEYKFTKKPETEIYGQYQVAEKLEIIGSKSSFQNVSLLFPLRKITQVEISITDGIALGIKPLPPIRLSGDLNGSSSIVIRGPKGEVALEEGVIIAKRHIHIDSEVAKARKIKDGQAVKIKIQSKERSLIFDDVIAKISPMDGNAMVHIDTDESNAANLKQGATGIILVE